MCGIEGCHVVHCCWVNWGDAKKLDGEKEFVTGKTGARKRIGVGQQGWFNTAGQDTQCQTIHSQVKHNKTPMFFLL